MSRFKQLVISAFAGLSLCACSKEEPNPELLDPIYQDLEKRQIDQQKAVDEATKNLSDLHQKLEKSEPNSPEIRDVRREIAKNEKILLISTQLARYYKIRTERRKVVDKVAYKEAFAAKKEWPYPHEYSDYLVNRRLVEASRNWGQRVPKLTERIPSSANAKAKPKPEKKEE